MSAPTPLRLSLASTSPALIAGFPQWLELELENPDPGLSLSSLGALALGESCPDLRIVARQGDAVVASMVPHFPSDGHGLAFGASLGPGQRRAGLFDLDEALALAPGRYAIDIGYPATAPMFCAQATVELELEAPTQLEAEVAQSRPSGGWMHAVLRAQGGIPTAEAAGSGRVHDLLRLHARLRAATWTGEPGTSLRAHEIAVFFDVLSRGLAAPADLLRHELGMLEGGVMAPGAGARLHARWPAWAWWLEDVERGIGPLARLRARRQLSEPELDPGTRQRPTSST